MQLVAISTKKLSVPRIWSPDKSTQWRCTFQKVNIKNLIDELPTIASKKWGWLQWRLVWLSRYLRSASIKIPFRREKCKNWDGSCCVQVERDFLHLDGTIAASSSGEGQFCFFLRSMIHFCTFRLLYSTTFLVPERYSKTLVQKDGAQFQNGPFWPWVKSCNRLFWK